MPRGGPVATSAGIGHNSRSGRIYAIAFDLDTTILEQVCPNSSWRNAYTDIKKALEPFGFTRQQGSVYFGDETVDPVRCVLAVMEISSIHGWFSPCVKDIRMLRIEENNDLMPAVERAVATSAESARGGRVAD